MQNGLLGLIQSKLPSWIYSDSELRKNSYSMYFKPYATLKVQCQTAYSTEDIQKSGMEIGKVSDAYFALFVSAIVVFIVLFIFMIVYYFMRKIPTNVVIILNLLDFLVHMIVFSFIQSLRNVMGQVNIEMF